MKKFTLFGILLSAAMLTSCGAYVTENTAAETVSETSAKTETTLETTVETSAEDTYKNVILPVVEKIREESDASDKPFGVAEIYSGTMFDYNNDGKDDYVFGYALYAQFRFVIIDSRDGGVLFDERIMTHLIPETKTEIYKNADSEYAFKITLMVKTPGISTVETVHIISDTGERVLEAVYDRDTNAFSHAYYDYDACKCYDKDEYIKKQDEFLSGYGHFADIEWSKTETFYNIPDKSGVIFLGENKVENLGGYADKNYKVTVEAAFENVLKTAIVPEVSKLVCTGTVLFKNEEYYVVKKVSESGDKVLTEVVFWVNAESGEVYVYLDPSLPVSECLSEFKNQIEADDFRSRLILVYAS